MTLSKKDFEQLAGIIERRLNDEYEKPTVSGVLRLMMFDLITFCEGHNPDFDSVKFIEACGFAGVTSGGRGSG